MRHAVAIVLLTVGSLVVFAWRPTALGLFTTQESIRVNVSREMQRKGEWLVPLRRGKAYIAKPPMVYWCQLGLASLRGGEVSVLDGRLNAAMWGWVGVLAAYFAGLKLLGGVESRAALLGAATLLTGVAHAQASRVGEIDVMLVGPVALAIACVHGAYGAVSTGRRWLWVSAATFAAGVAAMTKGPGPLAVIALGGPVGVAVGAWASGGGWRAGVRGVARVHPWLVLGLPALLFAWWLHAVGQRIGAEALGALVGFEAEDNLRWFELGAWVRNAEAMSYALGVFTLPGLIGVAVWLGRGSWREVGRAGVVAWVVLGFALFCVTTKGVGRYLLPLWPGLALASGWVIERWAGGRRGRWAVVVFALVLQGGVLAWFNAYGRVTAWGERSPERFMAEVATKVDVTRLGTLRFSFDALDYYAGRGLEVWGDSRHGQSIEELTRRMREEGGEYTILVLEENEKNRAEFGSAATILGGAGLEWDGVEVGSVCRRPPGDARVLAWRVRVKR